MAVEPVSKPFRTALVVAGLALSTQGCGPLTPVWCPAGADGGHLDAGAAEDAGVDAGTKTDAGTDAGTEPCPRAPAFNAQVLFQVGFIDGGRLAPAHNYATFRRPSSIGGRTDFMLNEFYTRAPVTNLALPAFDYPNCDFCFVYMVLVGCDDLGHDCAQEYLANSGTLTVSTATRNPDAGVYDFALKNVIYQSWDSPRGAFTDAGCFWLPEFSVHGTW